MYKYTKNTYISCISVVSRRQYTQALDKKDRIILMALTTHDTYHFSIAL